MNALVGFEALKLRTLRGTWLAAAVVAALAAVIGFAAVRLSDDPAPLALADVALAPAQAVWFVVVVVAVLASAGEFQHHTIRTTLLVAPRRGPVLVAKALAAAALGALLGTAAVAFAVAAGTVTAGTTGGSVTAGSAGDWVQVLASIGLAALWAVVATALGMLTRSTAMAIAAVLLWRFVGEGVLPVLARNPDLDRWMPSGAADALVGLGQDRLPVAAAAALLAGYAAAVCAVAAVSFLRRDPG